jgi:hypothetical protein
MAEVETKITIGELRWPHRLARRAASTLCVFFLLLVVLYLAALADEHFEARHAADVYNQLLTVRLGDTIAEFNRKVPNCKLGKTDGKYGCLVEPIRNRVAHPFDWYLMHTHHDAYVWQSFLRQKIGLRDWFLYAWGVTVYQGRLSKMHTQFFVTGREMMLGCAWGLTPEARRTNTSTTLSVTHINSSWSGWGYHMEFTPGSSAQDLRMREINVSCLTSFAGCRDSREFLPNLPPPEHTQYW